MVRSDPVSGDPDLPRGHPARKVGGCPRTPDRASGSPEAGRVHRAFKRSREYQAGKAHEDPPLPCLGVSSDQFLLLRLHMAPPSWTRAFRLHRYPEVTGATTAKNLILLRVSYQTDLRSQDLLKLYVRLEGKSPTIPSPSGRPQGLTRRSVTHQALVLVSGFPSRRCHFPAGSLSPLSRQQSREEMEVLFTLLAHRYDPPRCRNQR